MSSIAFKLAMDERSSDSPVYDLPCALELRFQGAQVNGAFGGLLEIERQEAFLDWVTYNHRKCLDRDIRGGYMCPMLWCRNSFKDHPTRVKHLTACACLSDGLYWCPDCSRPEQYTEDVDFTSPRMSTSRSTVPIPEATIPKARLFFKHFGLSNSPKGTKVPLHLPANIQASTRRPGKDAKERKLSSPKSEHQRLEKEERPTVMSAHLFPRYKNNKKTSADQGDDTPPPPHEVIRQGYGKGELGAGFDNQRYEVAGSVPDCTTSKDPVVSEWINEKGSYPGNCLGIAEADSGYIQDIRGSDLQGRSMLRPLQEMYDPSAPALELAGDRPTTGELHGSYTSSATFSTGITPSRWSTYDPFRDKLSNLPAASRHQRSSNLDSLSGCFSSLDPAMSLSGSPLKVLVGSFQGGYDNSKLEPSEIEDLGPQVSFPEPMEHDFNTPTSHPSCGMLSLGLKSDPSSDLQSPLALQIQQCDRMISTESEITWSRDGVPRRQFDRRLGLNDIFRLDTSSFETQRTDDQCRSYGAYYERSMSCHIGDNLIDDAFSPPRGYTIPPSDRLAPTQNCIKGLCDLVLVVNDELMGRLKSDPELFSQCPLLTVDELLALGLDPLRRFFKGIVSNTFENIFALLHVTCAVGYMLHKDDEQSCRDFFFQDLMKWQCTIADHSGRRSFFRIMHKISSQRMNSTSSTAESCFSNAMSDSDKLNMLRKGRVVKNCLRFIDDLEHTGIPERNDALGACHTKKTEFLIEDMIQKITSPLQTYHGIEAFRGIVKKTEYKLRCGLLRNPREVEVTLIASGRCYSRSAEMFDRYEVAVNTSCDWAMGQQGSRWRDRFYATALEQVLATCIELSNRQTLKARVAKQESDISVLAVVTPGRPCCDPPLSATIAENYDATSSSSLTLSYDSLGPRYATKRGSINTSATTASMTSPISPARSASCTETRDSYSTAPTTATTCSPTSPLWSAFWVDDNDGSKAVASTKTSESPDLPLSPTSPTMPTATISCHLCDKKFIPIWGNLQRHLKTVHGDDVHICPRQGCGKKIGRKDNLNKHLQKVHGESVCKATHRQSPAKRRRELGDVVEQEERVLKYDGDRLSNRT